MSKNTLLTAQLHDQQHLYENVILTTVSNLYNRIRISDLYTPELELNCCFIKIASLLSHQMESAHPADLLITASFVTQKFSSTLIRLYEQMPAPKSVMTLGGCQAIDHSLISVDSLLPVDVYLNECPLRSQTLVTAIAQLNHS